MSKEEPEWFRGAREFCRGAGIGVMGWGPDTLLVRAESPERAKQVTSQPRSFGLEAMEAEDDAQAGMLLLSRNPMATRAKQEANHPSIDVSKQPPIVRFAPLLVGLMAIGFFWWGAHAGATVWISGVVAPFLLFLSAWSAIRAWRWALQVSNQELEVRRRSRGTAIAWSQIRGVELTARGGRNQEAVTLELASGKRFRLETFGNEYVRALRNRLRRELAQRGTGPK